MSFVRVGPCFILAGDPTVAAGAGMKSMGFLEQVTIDLGIQTGYTSNSQLAGAPDGTSLFSLPAAPTVQAQAQDSSVAKLAEYVPGVQTFTQDDLTALGLGDAFTHLSPDAVPTVCIISAREVQDGASAANSFWIPAALLGGLDGIQHGRPQAGENGEPFNVEITSAYRAVDQDDEAIPVGARLGFLGPPAALGLTWSLPANIGA